MTKPLPRTGPPPNCSLCPRLFDFIALQRQKEPGWHNAPVASFGDPNAKLLIVGLAPGLSGANRTGRPFTGDYAGQVLYPALMRYGFAAGEFGAHPNDGLQLNNCRITNAVRCVPPQNKPIASEINTCRQFLLHELFETPAPMFILALGRIAHDSILKALDLKQKLFPFGHNRHHVIGDNRHLISSYHCSRYNINTGRLTVQMFDQVLENICRLMRDI